MVNQSPTNRTPQSLAPPFLPGGKRPSISALFWLASSEPLLPDTSSEMVDCFQSITTNLQRIADRLDPTPADIVDLGYISERLNVSTTHVARMAREGKIPGSCIVKGKAEGGLWKFYRKQIDQWIASR